MALPPPVPPSQKQPFWIPPDRQFANDQIIAGHDQVMYDLGEFAIFVLLWNINDFHNGLVGRCPTCFTGYGQIAEAYGQPSKVKCPDCFGTTYEGGYRAKIIRPAVITDVATDTINGPRGVITTDNLTIETTTDFFSHTGDYVIRGDNTRYSCDEMSTLVVRTGFDTEANLAASQSIGGIIPNARREDEASVAFMIPPTDGNEVQSLLASMATGRHLPQDLTHLDDLRGPLIV